jgi:hypothetical protein
MFGNYERYSGGFWLTYPARIGDIEAFVQDGTDKITIAWEAVAVSVSMLQDLCAGIYRRMPDPRTSIRLVLPLANEPHAVYAGFVRFEAGADAEKPDLVVWGVADDSGAEITDLGVQLPLASLPCSNPEMAETFVATRSGLVLPEDRSALFDRMTEVLRLVVADVAEARNSVSTGEDARHATAL